MGGAVAVDTLNMIRSVLIVLAMAAGGLGSTDDEPYLHAMSRLLNMIQNRTVHSSMEPRPMARPVVDASTPMEIDIEFSLQSVQGLDEKTGVLTSSAWVELSWINEYYVWDPEFFGGIENIRMSPSKVWVPDIYVFNDASGEYNARLEANNVAVLISSTGRNFWYTPVTIKSLCDMPESDLKQVNCSIVLGSWTHHAGLIDLQPTGVSADLSKFSGNSMWELIRVPANRHSQVYECCPEPYIDVTYTLELARRVPPGDEDNEDSPEDDNNEDNEPVRDGQLPRPGAGRGAGSIGRQRLRRLKKQQQHEDNREDEDYGLANLFKEESPSDEDNKDSREEAKTGFDEDEDYGLANLF